MTPTYVPKVDDRVRVVIEGTVTHSGTIGISLDVNGNDVDLAHSTVATLEVLPDPTPPGPLFVDGDIVAHQQLFGQFIVRVRRNGEWWFVSGSPRRDGATSLLTDGDQARLIAAGKAWRVDTSKPADAEPAPTPPFAFDNEGHEVGKTYTNRFGAHFTLQADHGWVCTKAPTAKSFAILGKTYPSGYPTRPLTEVTT